MSSISQATHLYVIRARWTPFLKIGITREPDRRLRQMQTECPHRIYYVLCIDCLRAYDVEQWVHWRARRRHLHGEWFWMFRNAHIVSIINQAVTLRECGDLPEAPPPWDALPKIQPEDRHKPSMYRDEKLSIYRELRTQGITREGARPILKNAGIPLDNNLWAEAAPEPPPR